MTTLYRPVGLKELRPIADSGFRKFPPRLPDQPFFYPVLSAEYARKIAGEWNTKDEFSEYIGCVTQFEVDDDTIKRHPPQTQIAGGKSHQELQVPAEEFNSSIIGTIKVTEVYIGEKAVGVTSDDFLSDTKEDVNWIKANSLKSDWNIRHCDFIPEPQILISFNDLAASYLDRRNGNTKWHRVIHYNACRFSFESRGGYVGVWSAALSLEASIYEGNLKPETKEFITREFHRVCDLMIAKKLDI